MGTTIDEIISLQGEILWQMSASLKNIHMLLHEAMQDVPTEIWDGEQLYVASISAQLLLEKLTGESNALTEAYYAERKQESVK